MRNNNFTISKLHKKGGRRKTGILARAWLWVMAFVTTVGLSFAPVSSVLAASSWDTAVQPISSLTILSDNGLHSQDITATYTSIMSNSCPDAYNSFVSASSSSNGRWAISQYLPAMGEKLVFVGWSTNSGDVTQFISASGYHVRAPAEHMVTLFIANNGNTGCMWLDDSEGDPGNVSLGTTTSSLYRAFTSTYPVTYPSGYEGSTIPSGSATDYDNDGLTLAQEESQDTSDYKKDTDGDGISDFIESSYNPDYDDTFCDTSGSPPYTCADPDPTAKDLFIEIDWMDDGTTEYKPTSTQLGLVETMLGNGGINVHFDTGQYGGGQEILIDLEEDEQEYLLRVPKSGILDYYDYRDGGDSMATGGDSVSAHFSSDRENVWRYMIYGYKYSTLDEYEQVQTSESTGWARVLGESLFVSAGALEDAEGSVTSINRSIANTIAHEIGHLLCLSGEEVYEEQPSTCVFEDIDSGTDNEDYESVMNYRYQLTITDDIGTVQYSDGTNGAEDHDDWEGIMDGMGLFNSSLTYVSEGQACVITKDTPSHVGPVVENKAYKHQDKDNI